MIDDDKRILSFDTLLFGDDRFRSSNPGQLT